MKTTTITRRDFIQTASFAAAGMLTLPSFLMKPKGKKGLGLQLYTLRSTIPTNPKEVLAKVAAYGYTELETYGYKEGKIFGMDFLEFGKYTKGLGMKVVSGHYGIDIIRNDWERAVKDAKAVGQKYMICPHLGEKDRQTIEDYKKRCAEFNKAGEICNQYGIRFGYHNHAFEFKELEGQIPYDVMLKELDPVKVGMELDIFWVVNAGFDPVQYFEKYPGRFEQWHVKDMDKNDKNRNADIGTGSIDYVKLFTKAKLSGLKHYYVEQESYPGEPINSVEASAKYMKSIR